MWFCKLNILSYIYKQKLCEIQAKVHSFQNDTIRYEVLQSNEPFGIHPARDVLFILVEQGVNQRYRALEVVEWS